MTPSNSASGNAVALAVGLRCLAHIADAGRKISQDKPQPPLTIGYLSLSVLARRNSAQHLLYGVRIQTDISQLVAGAWACAHALAAREAGKATPGVRSRNWENWATGARSLANIHHTQQSLNRLHRKV